MIGVLGPILSAAAQSRAAQRLWRNPHYVSSIDTGRDDRTDYSVHRPASSVSDVIDLERNENGVWQMSGVNKSTP